VRADAGLHQLGVDIVRRASWSRVRCLRTPTPTEWAAVERHFGGLPIEAGAREGWAWFELDPIDPSRGAGRAERDALRLAAILLAHWDNKAANQRLVCLAPAPSGPAPCPLPFALINDLGATFGPEQRWTRSLEGGADLVRPARCTSAATVPYSAARFQTR
jgi:hypothetical protein